MVMQRATRNVLIVIIGVLAVSAPFVPFVIWSVLWMGGPLSASESHFHSKVEALSSLPKTQRKITSWNELTKFDWSRTCIVKTYDTNDAVSARLGQPVKKYPLNWWASGDSYQGIAFATGKDFAETIRIPLWLVDQISGPNCFSRQTEVSVDMKEVNGLRLVVLNIVQ